MAVVVQNDAAVAQNLIPGDVIERILTLEGEATTYIGRKVFVKTWISSLSKLTLHTLGADLSGGCMNPASVMGWAFANGEHITKEHLVVYWLAPVQATFIASWVFCALARAKNDEEKPVAAKTKPAAKSKTAN